MTLEKPQRFYQQPFFVLCFLEFFERFGYYGFVYISVFYSIQNLHISEAGATALMGSFAALTYIFNPFGGFVADKILGIKRTMFLGAAVLSSGYFTLALFGATAPIFIFIGLPLVIVGSCLFKPAPTNLLASIYSNRKDVKLDVVYTFFYMSINIGSFCASLLIPYLSKHVGYTIALMCCASGLLFGIAYNVINYKSIKHVDNVIGHSKLNLKHVAGFAFGVVGLLIFLMQLLQNDSYVAGLLTIIAVCVFGYFIVQTIKETDKVQKNKMVVAISLLIYGVIFFVIYQQKNSSLMLFNKHHVNLHVFGINIDPQSVPGLLGTGGIIILTPIIAKIYKLLGDKDLALPHKFATGITLASSAYALLWFACSITNPSSNISFIWEAIAIPLFFCLGELLVSALGCSLMAQLVPEKMRGFSMGMWFITSSLGLKLGSFIASTVADKGEVGKTVELIGQAKIDSFLHYQSLFGWIAVIGLSFAACGWVLANKLNNMLGSK